MIQPRKENPEIKFVAELKKIVSLYTDYRYKLKYKIIGKYDFLLPI